ncbi:hypothetical protein MHYP_G00339140 [Metynnis hypsauchen]
MQQAREAGTQLSQLHSDRSPELDRYQEKAHQLTERWNGVHRQMETRLSDLEMLGSVLQQYREGHSGLIRWIEETTAKQENTQPEQTDSRALSEQLAQQTALVAEIEQNQVKLDECQTHSKHYCTAVKDYELQLMTFRAFVESTQKSPVKRRRMHSSSDAITQEFMDLRTRYTALVTLTTQHVKYISDALRRLEEEEKQVEEERQARVGEVSELLGWVKGLQERPAESSLAAQQAINEQLASKKEEITEAIRSTEVFLLSKQASKLSAEERAQVTSQLDDLTATYKQLCDSSAAQLQQLEEQLAKEEKRKDHKTVAGVIDLETMETFPVFQSARRGLIDQDTCRVLLEAQLVMGGLLQPDSPQSISLEESLATGLIDNCTYQSLLELETALHLVQQLQFTKSQFIPVAAALEMGHIKEQIALCILELQLSIGGLLDVSSNEILSLENAMTKGFLSVAVYNKLHSRLDRRELIDPNTAEKLNLSEFHQRCVLNQETGLRLLPVSQQSRGTVCLRSGRKVSVFRAVQEGLIDQQVTIRLLEAQLFAGGITDPRSGHRLTVDEAVRLGLMDQDLACALLNRQLQTGGIIDPASGERLELNEAIQRELLSPRMALRVLESLWTFMGMIWPESGELLSISDALQQGVVSGELAWKFLCKRHFVGAVYCPESGQVVPLACAEKILGTEVVEVLEKTRVPDALPAMIPTGSLNVSRWGCSSSPSLSSPVFSPPHLHDDTSFLEGAGSEEQAKYRLLCYLMTHSYINAGSGERLVLLEPELIELICQPMKDQSRPEPHLGEPSDREEPDFSMPFSEPEQRNIENLSEEHKRDVPDNAVYETKKVKTPLEVDAAYEEKSSTDRNLVKHSDNDLELAETIPEIQTLPPFIKQVSILPTDSVLDLFTTEVKEIKREETVLGLPDPRPLSIEMPKLNQCLLEEKVETAPSKNKRLGIGTENTAADISFEDVAEESQDGQVDQNDRLDKINLPSIAREGLQVKKIEVTDISDQMDTYRNTESTDSSKIPKMISMEQIDEDAKLEDMAKQLLQGGLLTDGAQKLLLDKAVSQGVLPGHTAVKVMSKAGLFGGFLDVSACKSLSIEDVMQEGLLDEDLMTSVLQSEKTLAGVIDVEHGQICSLKDAAQTGLLDPDTVARLLEAQVVSGGIVDLRRGKKVSVTLAANLGLIEEAQKEDLLAVEKSCHGKSSDPYTSHTKLTLQLQMDGVVDPKTKQPLSLQQAIQKGIIGHKEAQQILMQQVAEGGIVHHGSGIRLTVADSVQEGLIDKSFVEKLEDFEKSCQRQEQFSSDPNSISVQASVGFIYDSVSKSRLALTEAVSHGFIDEDTANKAMASPNVRSGVLDPHSACILPYLELINQGKIDIETGRRFFEVRPFRGIPHKQNGGMMTLPEAVKTGQVDPVPALRVLQSQADSGGIISISDGKRLTIPEAVDKGLVEKDIARVIATNQIVKGGLINPSSGHRVSDLKEAVQEGLISREMAAELRDNFGPVGGPSYKEEGTATVGPSTSGMYSPLVSNQVSHSNSQHESTEVSAAHLSESEKADCMITAVLEAPQPEKTQLLQHYAPYEIEEQTHKVISSSDLEINTDASLEALTHFALKTEKRLQQAIEDFGPGIYKEQQHQLSEVQIPQLSETEFENGKKYDTTPTPDHTPESDSQMQPEVELAPTKTYTKLENYEKSDYSIAPDTTHTIHDGQAPSSEETNGQFSEAAEQQSSSYAKAVCESKQNVENRKDIALFTTEEGQNIQVKKRGKGNYMKQARIGTERDESLDSKFLDVNTALPSEGTVEMNRKILDTHEESVKEVANLQKEGMTELEDGNSTTVDVENKILKDVPDIDHEEVQVNLEVRELSVVTPPEDTENKSIRVMAAFDEKTVEDVKEKKVEVQLESLTTQDVSVASVVKDTESKTGNYVLGIDKKSADGKNDIKEYLEAQQPLDLSVTSPIESTENKSGKEAVVIDQKTEEYGKFEQENKLHLDALQPPDINVVPQVEGTDNRMRTAIGVLDQKSIDVKVDLVTLQPPGLGTTSLVEDIEYKSGNEAVDQESEVKLEKNDKLDSQVILDPDTEQTSIERNEEMEKLVKVKLTGAPEISYSIAFPGGLQQRDVMEEVVVSLQKQPTEDGKMSLGAEMAKEKPASLQDDYNNSDHKLHSQMQHQGINETKPEYDKEVDASEVHVPEQTDKKRKKKKRKKPKEMLPSMANAEKEAEENTDVVTTQSEKLNVVEIERMEHPQKPNQAQLEKETLLMKAKQSILKKVFERGVTEKQAAKELEAFRQGSGKERHTAIHQKPNTEQDSSTSPTREKDETHQKMQVNTNAQLVAGDAVAGTNSKQNYYSQTAPDISHLRSSVSVTEPASDFCKKQDLSTKETSHVVAMDSSKQRLTHIDLDEKAGEGTTEEVEHESLRRRSGKLAIKTSQVSEQLWPALDEGSENSKYDFTESVPTVTIAREPAAVLPIEFTKNEAEKPGLTTLEVNEQSYTTLSEGKSVPPIKLDKDSASLPQRDVDVQTSITEPNSINTELLQDVVKDYGHVDSEAKDEAFLQESTQSEDIPESDVTEQEKEKEEAYEGVDKEQVDEPKKKQGATPQISKSSLARQECLEHDQRILALLSMVRHTEVCLKQQQQQSVGRSLIALDDIIKQTETLALELCDLEPQVNKELEASRQLLGSHLEDVPPQLLVALEKDGRSLSRAFDAARELSQSVLQGMKSHRDAHKVAVNNELQSLGGQVDNLLVWLKQTEAQMERHTREEKMMENESRTLVHLAQRLQQCKELEEHLAARSSDVSTVAFDIQVFISECAQDLEPEQSRHLLRQLQQLQRAFHQATGRAHARAEALSVQQAREEEREQKEKEQEGREREREKQTAMKKEIATEDKRLCPLGKG